MDNMNIRTDKRANRKISRTAICRLLIVAVTFPVLGGCVKDDLYNTAHPDKGAVKITTDWSGRSSDAVIPHRYVLRIGTHEQTVSGETNAFGTLFLPGKQDLLVWHTAQGITVSGTTVSGNTVNGTIATINTLPDGTLDPTPGHLFSAARELDIAKDDTLSVTLPMKQYIRRLVLTLKLSPGDEQRIGSTAATLTGIASATDLVTGKLTDSAGKTVIPTFVLTTDTPESRSDTPETRSPAQPVLSATLHLMGAATGEQQLLTLEITLTDGDVHTVTTDLTEMLKDFRTGTDMEPLTLDAALSLPTEAGIGATITPWKEVNNGDINVN